MTEESKGRCPQCEKEDSYSEHLTRGLCLTCHYTNEREEREMDMECEHDQYQESNS